jgi:hypothetical protein
MKKGNEKGHAKYCIKLYGRETSKANEVYSVQTRKKAATTMDSKTCTFVYPVYLEITGLYCVSEGSPSIKATSCSPIQCPQQFSHCCYHSASSSGQVFVVFLSTPTVPQTSTWPSTDVLIHY